jgi:excisionase family DNA binding protein
MQDTQSPLVLDDQTPTANPAIADGSAGEQRPHNPTDSGLSKRKRSSSGVGSLSPRSLRVNDAAAIYGLSRSTLYKLMQAGGPLRSVVVGGRRLIPVDALEALIGGNGVPPPCKPVISSPSSAGKTFTLEGAPEIQDTAEN